MAPVPPRVASAVLLFLRDAVRGLLFLAAGLLAADLLALTLVGPSILLGAWAGVPVTVVALVAAGLGVRRVVRARRGPAERQRLAERAEAERRIRRQGWARKLRVARIPRPHRSTYREAAGEMSGPGFLLGLGAGWILVPIVGVSSLPAALAVLFGAAALGVVVAIEYDVHLEERFRRRRCRRLTRRLMRHSPGAAPVADVGTGADDALTQLIDACDPDFGADHGDAAGHDSGCGSGCGSGD